MTRAAKPPADSPRCTHLGCETKPTRRIQGEYDRYPWFGCPKHAPGMESSFHIGQPQGYRVANTPIVKGGKT